MYGRIKYKTKTLFHNKKRFRLKEKLQIWIFVDKYIQEMTENVSKCAKISIRLQGNIYIFSA